MNPLVLFVFLIVIYYLFITQKSEQSENFAGVGSENPFTNLTCLHEDPNNVNSIKHVLKVSPSLNQKKGYYTYHKLLHPDKLSKTDGTQYVNYDDIVETGETIPCDDGHFSTYFVKKMRDETSKARKLFNKINSGQTNTNKSTWQQHECTVTDINNKSHWCNKIHNTILNNLDKVCSTKAGDVPANYCSSFKDTNIGLKEYVNSNDNTLKNQVNYLKSAGIDKVSALIRNVGAVPQEITLDNGEYHCFKDNYGNSIDSTGSMCYNSDSNKNIKPYAPKIDKNSIMCNPGDTLNSTICKNASGVAYNPDLSDPSNPKCNNDKDTLDPSGNAWSICNGTGLFDTIDSKLTNPTFATVLNKITKNDTKCTADLIKNGKGPIGGKGFCVRAPTTDEINALKNTNWYNSLTNVTKQLAF